MSKLLLPSHSNLSDAIEWSSVYHPSLNPILSIAFSMSKLLLPFHTTLSDAIESPSVHHPSLNPICSIAFSMSKLLFPSHSNLSDAIEPSSVHHPSINPNISIAFSGSESVVPSHFNSSSPIESSSIQGPSLSRVISIVFRPSSGTVFSDPYNPSHMISVFSHSFRTSFLLETVILQFSFPFSAPLLPSVLAQVPISTGTISLSRGSTTRNQSIAITIGALFGVIALITALVICFLFSRKRQKSDRSDDSTVPPMLFDGNEVTTLSTEHVLSQYRDDEARLIAEPSLGGNDFCDDAFQEAGIPSD
jgi:hypothetical protein